MLEDSNLPNPEIPDPEPGLEPAAEPAPEVQLEEKGNRTFLVIGSIFAGLIFLTLVCAAIYFLLIRPRTQSAQTAQEATLSAQRLEQAQALTATAEASAAALALPNQTNTSMPAATLTPVVVLSTPAVVVSTSAAPPTSDPAALVAMQTQLAAQMTQTAGPLVTSSAGGTGPLPTTGFFDEVGLPLMVLLTFALLGVILVARRMRKSSH